MRLRLAAALLTAALVAGGSGVEAREYHAPPAEIDAILVEAADTYGMSLWSLRRLSWCESDHNPNAYNAAGPYRGLGQFDADTWAGSPYAHLSPYDGWASAHAIAWYVVSGPSGKGEPRRWPVCGRIAGLF
jgi:hypothetical protein